MSDHAEHLLARLSQLEASIAALNSTRTDSLDWEATKALRKSLPDATQTSQTALAQPLEQELLTAMSKDVGAWLEQLISIAMKHDPDIMESPNFKSANEGGALSARLEKARADALKVVERYANVESRANKLVSEYHAVMSLCNDAFVTADEVLAAKEREQAK